MPKPRGYARVEYLAVKPEVEALLARGYTLAFVYRQLSREGKISMGYEQFSRYVSGVAKLGPAADRPLTRKKGSQASSPPASETTSSPELMVLPVAGSIPKEPIFQPGDFNFPNQVKKDV